MSIGERIKKLRNKKGITQLELANKLFVTDKTVSSWELDRTEPSLEVLVKLSDILDYNVGYLIYGDNPKNDVETEIKIKITESEYKIINEFMNKNSEILKENNRQLDTYYQPSYRKFLNEVFLMKDYVEEEKNECEDPVINDTISKALSTMKISNQNYISSSQR